MKDRHGLLEIAALIIAACALVAVWYWPRNHDDKKLAGCKDPVFLQAVGHYSRTTWVYGCADGSMIELSESLPSAPIGTPDGWAGGR